MSACMPMPHLITQWLFHIKTTFVVPDQSIDRYLAPRNALTKHVFGEGGDTEEWLQYSIHVTSVPQVGESEMIFSDKMN